MEQRHGWFEDHVRDVAIESWGKINSSLSCNHPAPQRPQDAPRVRVAHQTQFRDLSAGECMWWAGHTGQCTCTYRCNLTAAACGDTGHICVSQSHDAGVWVWGEVASEERRYFGGVRRSITVSGYAAVPRLAWDSSRGTRARGSFRSEKADIQMPLRSPSVDFLVSCQPIR